MFYKFLRPKYFFLALFFFSLTVFFLHTAYTKTAIFADARFYFMTARSIVKDHDIKFANEYVYFGMDSVYVNEDYVWNMYPPGVSLFWLPGFFWAEGLTNILMPLNTNIDSSGFGIIHQSFTALTNIFLGTLGLYLVFRLLSQHFSKAVSHLTIIGLFSATNLLFYMAVEPINSHAASFFMSSFFIFYFLRYQKAKYYYFTLGVIGGIAGLVRTQDLLILILPIIQIIIVYKNNFKALAAFCLILSAGAIVAFIPQFYFWQRIFGTFWYSPYLPFGFNILKPQIFHVLFNTQNGLFTLTPIVAFSFLGLILMKKNFYKVRLYALIYFLGQLYLISSWNAYYQGGSYSIRMMVTAYPFISFGLASVINSGLKVLGERKVLFLITILGLTNIIFIVGYLLKY
jgi:hypothetical protein